MAPLSLGLGIEDHSWTCSEDLDAEVRLHPLDPADLLRPRRGLQARAVSFVLRDLKASGVLASLDAACATPARASRGRPAGGAAAIEDVAPVARRRTRATAAGFLSMPSRPRHQRPACFAPGYAPSPAPAAGQPQPAPATGSQPQQYGQQPPQYGQPPLQYGQPPPQYGQPPPQYGQAPPQYGQPQQQPYGQPPPQQYGQQPGQQQPNQPPPPPLEQAPPGGSKGEKRFEESDSSKKEKEFRRLGPLVAGLATPIFLAALGMAVYCLCVPSRVQTDVGGVDDEMLDDSDVDDSES